MDKKRQYLNGHGFLLKTTSGSTGYPLEVIKSIRENSSDYMYLNSVRRKITTYNFNGLFLWIWPANPISRKIAYADDQLNTIIKINKYGYQYMLYEHAESDFKNICDFIRFHKIQWITTSPSVMCSIAEYVQNNNITLDSLQYIECQSEYLYEWQREKIIESLKICPVSVYSSNEIQFIGIECKNKNMHVLQSKCFLEIVNKPDGDSQIFVTSFNYLDLPLIRYQLGDCGHWSSEQKCNCLLNEWPSFTLNRYRTNDYIALKNGNRMEPYIISDSMLFANNQFSLNVTQYRVKQIYYDCFEYILRDEIRQTIMTDLKVFLEMYLSKLMNYNIRVIIKCNQKKDFLSFANKYNYFVNEVKL